MNRRGEVATLFTIATLAVIAVGTFLGAQRAIQEGVLKLGGFAYDYTKKAHFYTGPTVENKGDYILVRGSLCFTGTTIPSQPQRFWVHTPKDPNRGYPQKACDNTNADTKDDCIVYEGKTVEYIASQVSRPYCDSPDVGKKNWRAWDFTLKLNKPLSQALCQGLFVTATSSFVFRDEIDLNGKSWQQILKDHGVDCGPTPSEQPTATGQQPTNTPIISSRPTATPTSQLRGCLQPCANTSQCLPGFTCKNAPCPRGQACPEVLRCVPDDPADPRCSRVTPTPTSTPGTCGQPCGFGYPRCGGGFVCVTPTPSGPTPTGPIIIVDQPGRCRPADPRIQCPQPTVTPIDDCRTDITCGPRDYQCPSGYSCIRARGQQFGRCVSDNPACFPPPSSGPTPYLTIIVDPLSPTPGVQAKIKGTIVVNSCKRPDNVTTIICSKNNPTLCIERAAPVTFVGQDPTNPNKWIYNYEHLTAPRASGAGDEPIERSVLYENMQVFAQYAAVGLVKDAGRVGYPPAQLGNLRAYASIPSNQSEAIINYEVPQNNIVCPQPSPVLTIDPTTIVTTIVPSNTPTPGICEYEATVEVKDTAGNLIPVSQLGDANKWGVANDKQSPKPYNVFKQYGTEIGGVKMSSYTYKTDTMTFRPENPAALYTKGEKAFVNLYIDTSQWKIVSKTLCSGRNCPRPNEPIADGRPLDQYGDKANGFTIDCGTQVRYGWTVERISAPQCVLRDVVNAERCTPKNVEARMASTSTVAIRWDRPDDACDFRAGVNGDHYKIDIVDFTEDPFKVIKSCDSNITRAECTLDPTYNPNSKGTRGNFKRGHNYNISVYAVKEIPGASDICASMNGKDSFTRPQRDEQTPTDTPEPTSGPIGGGGTGGTVLTRQLDWMVGESGVCWAGWSHGDCRLAYNGTNEWVKSKPDGRFKCLAPYNQNKVIIGLMKGQPEIDMRSKKVDCLGNTSNACVAAAGTNISQCASSLSNATTYNGPSIKLKPGECWELDENLGLHPFSCPATDPGEVSRQPAPRNPGQPAPTAAPTSGPQTTTLPTNAPTAVPTPRSNPVPRNAIAYTVADTHVSSNNPNNNYGGQSRLVVGQEPGIAGFNNTFTSYLGFNLGDHIGRQAKTAQLVLYVERNAIPSGKKLVVNLDLNSYSPVLNLNESKITFNNRPQPSGLVGTATLDSKTKLFTMNLDTTVINRIIANGLFTFNGFILYQREGTDYTGFVELSSKESTNSLLRPHINLEFKTDTTTRSGEASNSLVVTNNGSKSINSVSVTSCDSSSKCSVNDISLAVAAGASTKFKPDFSIPANTRRLSCVVTYADGTRKQCTPQVVTQNSGNLQFNITTQADGSVRTLVLSPLKTADTNGDCVVTGVDGAGLRDLDGNGRVDAVDTSLFFFFLGQNACR